MAVIHIPFACFPIQPEGSGLGADEISRSHLGATMGVAGAFKEIGDMLGPLLIGLVSQFFRLTTGFVACGALGLLSLGLIIRLRAKPEG